MPAPFVDPADDFDDSPLEAREIDRVREIVRSEALSTITTLCANLSASQCQHMRGYLDQYFNDIGTGSAMEMSGGQDGIKISEQGDRNDIRNRVMGLLNLPGYTSSSLFRLNVVGEGATNYGSEY